MALPSFRVVGNLFEILGGIEDSELEETSPTTLRWTFKPNLADINQLVTYESKLYRVVMVYAGMDENGDIYQADIVNGKPVISNDQVRLLAEDPGLNVSGLQWKASLETPLGADKWRTLTSWSFDAYADGATVNLANEAVTVESIANTVVRQGATAQDIEAAIEGINDVSTVALVNRMSVRPDYDRRIAINTLITNLKDYDLWDRLDGLYLFAAHTQQAALLNWRRDTANMTAVNAPVFTTDVGFTGDGAAAYLSNVSSETVNAEVTDMAVSLWMTDPTFTGWKLWMSSGWNVGLTNSSSLVSWRIGREASTDTALGAVAQAGIYTLTRTASDQAYLYKEGSVIGTDTNLYTDPGAVDTTLPLRLLTTSGTTSFSDATVSFAAYGASMNDSEVALFYRAVFDYMTAVGVA